MLDAFKTLANGILEKAKSFKGDWNENDSSSPHYVKNRTHWTEPGIQIVIDENIDIIDEDGSCYAEIRLKNPIEYGKTYQVSFNGTEYECKTWMYDDSVCLGNGSLYETNKGNDDAPFAISYYEYTIGDMSANTRDVSVNYECYVDALEAGSVYIKISTEIEKVHKIDKKYLPEMSNIGQEGTGSNSEIFNDYKRNSASGDYSHAEGADAHAGGDYSHAGGYYSFSDGYCSFVHGNNSSISESGSSSAAFGDNIYINNAFSFGAGYYNTINAEHSASFGSWNEINHSFSFLFGDTLQSSTKSQFITGKYNKNDLNAAFIIGNGSSSRRSNIFTVSKNGDAWMPGNVFVGGDSQDNYETKLLSEKEFRKPKNYTTLVDQDTGKVYSLQIQSGKLITMETAERIRIKTMPNKLTFMDGDRVDVSGLELDVIYSDGSIEVGDNKNVTVSPEYVKTGDSIITITYDHYGVDLNVNYYITTTSFDHAVALQDFNYKIVSASDYSTLPYDTYQIIGWKGHTNGKSGTECIVPDNKYVTI